VGARWARRPTSQGGRSPIAHGFDGDLADAHRSVRDLEFFDAFSIVKGRREGQRKGRRRGHRAVAGLAPIARGLTATRSTPTVSS
jgi:hypothetical protein